MSGEIFLGMTFVAYFLAAALLCWRGWVISAGIATFVISLAPMTREIIVYPDSEAPGTAFFVMALFPLSGLLVLLGIMRLVLRGLAGLPHRSKKQP